MSIYSPTDSLHDLNSDEGMMLNYNTCASEKKRAIIGGRIQPPVAISRRMIIISHKIF
jgi:hypothetical protein